MSCFRAVGTHLWVQISKVPPKLERALVELALKRLQPTRIGFLCQRHISFFLYDCSVTVDTLRTSRPSFNHILSLG